MGLYGIRKISRRKNRGQPVSGVGACFLEILAKSCKKKLLSKLFKGYRIDVAMRIGELT
jgi:hypothetical protein